MAAGNSRSPTARRVWIWLDAADPREAAALAAYDRLQAGLPARVRAALLRDIMCRGLAEIEARLDDTSGDGDYRSAARTGRSRADLRRQRTVTAPRIEADPPRAVKVEPADVAADPVHQAEPETAEEPETAGEPAGGGLMW